MLHQIVILHLLLELLNSRTIQIFISSVFVAISGLVSCDTIIHRCPYKVAVPALTATFTDILCMYHVVSLSMQFINISISSFIISHSHCQILPVQHRQGVP